MVLTGQKLVQALSTTPFALLRVIAEGSPEPVAIVTPEQAIALLAAGAVEAVGSQNRVRYLRTKTRAVKIPAARGVFEKCWRNQAAAVLWPWVETPEAMCQT